MPQDWIFILRAGMLDNCSVLGGFEFWRHAQCTRVATRRWKRTLDRSFPGAPVHSEQVRGMQNKYRALIAGAFLG